MIKISSLLAILLIFNGSCKSKSVIDIVQSKTVDSNMSKYEIRKNISEDSFSEVEYIEMINRLLPTTDSMCNYMLFSELKDTLFLKLYYKNNKPIMLTYTTFDDAGLAKGFGAYYFNEIGFLIGQNLYLGTKNIFEIYRPNNRIFKFKLNNDIIEIINIDSISAKYREAIAILYLDIYMQLFDSIKYKTSMVSDDISPILSTNTEVLVFNQPSINSEQSFKLEIGQKINFIKTNKQIIKVDDLKWLWYYIKTSDGKYGWVFGHPNFVKIINDENCN